MIKTVAVLHPKLIDSLKKVREQRAFNPEEWIEKKSDLFNDYMKRCGLKGM